VSSVDAFDRCSPQTSVASRGHVSTAHATTPGTPVAPPSTVSLRALLFGRPLRTDEEHKEKIGPVRGVAVLGLDALASAAYGPEAALTALVVLGALATHYILPLSAVILVVLVLVYFSYRQTIAAYPGGGGSFTVASQNLGRGPGVLAASALGLDYILNVAVAIAAGVGAVVSVAPSLLSYTLPLCLGILLLLTILNLRGIREAGLVLMSPTWWFVGTLGLTIAIGVVKSIAAGGHPEPLVAPAPPQPALMTTASLFLLMRAFASGTTAMTGVEAVSNGVPIFRRPMVKSAQRTLSIIVAILGLFLAGIAYLCTTYHIVATPPGVHGYQSVLSQLVGAIAGRGWFYHLVMAGILSVLCLSANTSFADFPRLCRLLALDEYLPAAFAHRGSRLVFTLGIVVLAVASGLLLIAFGGITDHLIPLFALGALTAFTMSQWGMVAHWRRTGGPHVRSSMLINGLGAMATSVTAIVVLIAKFTEGAWISFLAIAGFMALLLSTRRRAERVDAELGTNPEPRAPLDVRELPPPIVVVPLHRLDRLARKALELAIKMSPDVEAVQVLTDDPQATDLRRDWMELVIKPVKRAGRTPPTLTTIPSPYREYTTPLLEHIQEITARHPDRDIAVVVAEVVRRRWYHVLVPSRAMLLKTLIRLRGDPRVVIVDTAWYLED
jgi:amino acid transporter